MGQMILRREVLPPRQAPTSPRDFVSEERVREAIMRSIWTSAALIGLAHVLTRVLETW